MQRFRGNPHTYLFLISSQVRRSSDTGTRPHDTTIPESSAPSSSQPVATVADYQALLRQVLPFQQRSLSVFHGVLQEERLRLEHTCAEFDKKIHKMEALRDEIRALVEEADRRSILRRDEIVHMIQQHQSPELDSTGGNTKGNSDVPLPPEAGL